MPAPSGTHHFRNRSGLHQASYTRRAGALNARVATNSRSDLRSTFVGFSAAALLALAIFVLLAFEVFDDPVESVEALAPELVVPGDPGGFFLEPARPELAGADAADLLRDHEAGLLEHADVLLHAGQGHVEAAGQVADRGV